MFSTASGAAFDNTFVRITIYKERDYPINGVNYDIVWNIIPDDVNTTPDAVRNSLNWNPSLQWYPRADDNELYYEVLVPREVGGCSIDDIFVVNT
jgi:hypothetical protein